jgi:hypothetical protein
MTIITISELNQKIRKGEDTSQFLTKPDNWNDRVTVPSSKILALQTKKAKEIEEARIQMQKSKTWATRTKYQQLIDKLTAEYNSI